MLTRLHLAATLAFCLCFGLQSAHAQLSFAQTDYASPGDTQLVGIDTTTATLTAGAAGMNQTWDYSALAVDDSTTVQVTDGSGTPYSSSFSDADLAFQINALYVYQVTDTDTLNDLGLGIEVELGGTTFNRAVRYSEPFKAAVFPIEMNATWSDQASFTVGATSAEVGQSIPGADSVRWTRTTNKDVTVDATGTLYLPNDTITDVIRVASTEYHRDDFEAKFILGGWSALNLPGIIESPTFDTTTTYTYYSADFNLPVMTFTTGTQDSVGDGGVSFYHPPRQGTISGRPAHQLTGISVYPNPIADQSLNLHIADAQLGESIVSVISTDGRLVQQASLPSALSGDYRLKLNNIAAGSYLLHISNAGGQYHQRIVVR